MKAVLELNIEGTVSVETLQRLGSRAMDAISGDGPRVQPRLLLEMSPNYLEIPLMPSKSKHPEQS
ncbi:hypothetical protein ES706_04783 [subsurface metagenome]